MKEFQIKVQLEDTEHTVDTTGVKREAGELVANLRAQGFTAWWVQVAG